MFRSAYLVTRDSTLAEETAKTAFVRAYRSLGSLEAGARLQPWLMRLTDTVARTQLREMSQRRDAKVADRDPCRRVAARPVQLVRGAPAPNPLQRTALADAFDGLMDNDRVIIAARYAFGLGRAAAATRLEVEADEVDGRLLTSLARLRARVAEIMGRAASPATDPRSGTKPSAAGWLESLADDQLGSMTMAVLFSELPWTPDVAPLVCGRLSREAVAYPEAPAMASSGARATPEPATSAARSQVSTRRSGRLGLSPSRSMGLVAGIALVTASVAFGVGFGGRGSGLPADASGRISAAVGEPGSAAAPVTATRSAGEAAPPAAVASPVGPSASVPGTVAAQTVARPDISVVGARLLKGGSLGAVVRVDLPAAIDPDATVRARLERRIGNAGWKPIAWTGGADPLLASVKPGTRYLFRVRAVDMAGDWTVSEASRVKLAVRGPGSERLTRTRGDWRTRRSPTGRRRLVATEPGARMRTAFKGSDVALVGRLGPSQDAVKVRVDGGPWVRDAVAGARSGRSVLFSEDLDDGRHVLDVRALADGLAVDAILILRSSSA